VPNGHDKILLRICVAAATQQSLLPLLIALTNVREFFFPGCFLSGLPPRDIIAKIAQEGTTLRRSWIVLEAQQQTDSQRSIS
jgi:hypothetical protein